MNPDTPRKKADAEQEPASVQTYPVGELIKDVDTLRQIVGTYTGLYGDPDKGVADFFKQFSPQKLKEIAENFEILAKKGAQYIPGMENTLKITPAVPPAPSAPHRPSSAIGKGKIKI